MFISFRNEKGFTLVEVLLTIALIGILTVSVLSLFTNVIIRQRKIANRTIAIHFAQAGLEQIVADKYLKGYDYLIEKNYYTETFNGVQQRTYITGLHAKIKKIIVVVTWGNGVDSLVTLIGNY